MLKIEVVSSFRLIGCVEWRTGNKGRLILYDEDSTTKTEGEWKKLNTLSHYRVPGKNSVSIFNGMSITSSNALLYIYGFMEIKNILLLFIPDAACLTLGKLVTQ